MRRASPDAAPSFSRTKQTIPVRSTSRASDPTRVPCNWFAQAGERERWFANAVSRALGSGLEREGGGDDGQGVALAIGLNPVRTPDGLRVLASIVDIGARKRAEQALQKERDFIDAVLETAGALVVVLDREGRMLRFNRACEQTTSYSSEEVMG